MSEKERRSRVPIVRPIPPPHPGIPPTLACHSAGIPPPTSGPGSARPRPQGWGPAPCQFPLVNFTRPLLALLSISGLMEMEGKGMMLCVLPDGYSPFSPFWGTLHILGWGHPFLLPPLPSIVTPKWLVLAFLHAAMWNVQPSD